MPENHEDAVLGTQTYEAEFEETTLYKDGIQEYSTFSMGIPAMQYNDTIYYRTYIEVDGEVYYGDIIEYSVVTYCKGKLDKAGTSEKLKTLLAAMLNYGAAAQQYKKYNTDALANECLQGFVNEGKLDAKHLTLSWDGSLLTDVTVPDASMTVNFPVNEAANTAKNLALEGAIQIKMTFAHKLNGKFGTELPEGASVALYFWTESTYKKLLATGTPLSKDNAEYIKTGDEIVGSYDATYGYEYYAMSEGIPAMKLGETLFVAAVFTMEDGTEYCSGVAAYSAEEYAKGRINKANAAETLKTLVKWMVVYGEAAYAYKN